MMMHVRDCPGTTPSYDVCPYPWCRKTKHLLYHLVTCEESDKCQICSPVDLNPNLKALVGLNNFRRQKQSERQSMATSSTGTSSGSKHSHHKNGGASHTLNQNTSKRSTQQRRVSRNGTTLVSGARVVKTSKAAGRNSTYTPPLTTVTKKTSLSVPSPIPTTSLSSIKPSNPLNASQNQVSTGRSQNTGTAPAYTTGRAVTKQPSLVTKSTKLTTTTTHISSSKVPANPLNALPPIPPPPTIHQKAASPPNPLKKLHVEVSTMQKKPSQFPTLPDQISMMKEDSTNSATNDRHPVLRTSSGLGIKVEGNQ